MAELLWRRSSLILCLWLFATAGLSFLIVFGARVWHSRQGCDPKRFCERLGYPSVAHETGEWLWFHAASLGEVSQIRDLASKLRVDFGYRILVTTITATGAEWVAREMPDAVHQYAPLDTPDAVRRFLDNWVPRVAVFVEGDLWPRLVLEAAKRSCQLILANARTSISRQRMPKTFASLLSSFSLITCKSEAVYKEIFELGVSEEKMCVLGDLKAEAGRLTVQKSALEKLRREVGDRPVWVAASTHEGDENGILRAHKLCRVELPDALLIWAPRHPARACDIRAVAIRQGMTVVQRSLGEEITLETDIYLADTLGELGIFFTLSQVAFLGGSFGAEGGHNPFEPAHFGCAIFTGPHVRNFSESFAALENCGAAKTFSDGDSLGRGLVELLATGHAKIMGGHALLYLERAAGSVTQTAERIRALTLPKPIKRDTL